MIVKTFDWHGGALPVFEAIRDKPSVFFLDSSMPGNGLGRYSFLGFEPFGVLRAQANGNFLKSIRELLKKYKINSVNNLPFCGGAVGYISYDFGFCFEDIPQKPTDRLQLPTAVMGLYDTVIIVDHLKNKLHIVSTGLPEKNSSLARIRAKERLGQVADIVNAASPIIVGTAQCAVPTPEMTNYDVKKDLDLVSSFTKEEYLSAVKKAKDYIRKGDIYQVNLSQSFSGRNKTDAYTLYQRLRSSSPSNFSAYFDCGDFQILSSSPERFLDFDGKNVTTRPMKGTRKRGENKKQDRRLKNELTKSAKDKAELMMIVDLLRNDLGRVCEYGSIKVKSMRDIETYSTVYQATAQIEGVLHKDKDRIDLLRACFPGGSITGCPKIRSMQIIEELEPDKRHIYTGSLGYFGFNNTMDLNILIRTILKKDDMIYFQTGGGIVADSDPESEYEETLIKAQGIFKAIGNR